MNYYKLINTIKTVCLEHKLIHEFQEGDVYKFNTGQRKYPATNLTVQSISDVDSQERVQIVLFCFDRLLDDNSNKVEIQSNTLTILRQIIARLEEEYKITFESKNYTPFSEKFADLVAGFFLSASIITEKDVPCDDENIFE